MAEVNKIRLSPTAIACYFECQRKFYYKHIRGIEEKPRPSQVRGKIAHKVLEHFYTFVDLTDIEEGNDWKVLWERFRKVLFSILDTEWSQIGKLYPDCFRDEKQKTRLLNETKEFLDFYAIKLAFSLVNKLRELDKKSEWFSENVKRFFYPKDREMRLELEDEDMAGFVDKTMSIFGKGIAIVDYKTSKCTLPHFIPEGHLKQGKAYAFLWNKIYKELPKHISFYYLRTGESVFYPISERDIEEIKSDIKEIRSKKPVIEEFSKKETGLCKFCDFSIFCFKKEPVGEE
jgi:CRISPR/Cas system-associated exonuclease Cas4 (RecB family)